MARRGYGRWPLKKRREDGRVSAPGSLQIHRNENRQRFAAGFFVVEIVRWRMSSLHRPMFHCGEAFRRVLSFPGGWQRRKKMCLWGTWGSQLPSDFLGVQTRTFGRPGRITKIEAGSGERAIRLMQSGGLPPSPVPAPHREAAEYSPGRKPWESSRMKSKSPRTTHPEARREPASQRVRRTPTNASPVVDRLSGL
jgi:hypothetical protein